MEELMPEGSHVTEEECAEIRRLKARGRWVWLTAEQMGVTDAAVYYHVLEKCSHPPPPDDLHTEADDEKSEEPTNPDQEKNRDQ